MTERFKPGTPRTILYGFWPILALMTLAGAVCVGTLIVMLVG